MIKQKFGPIHVLLVSALFAPVTLAQNTSGPTGHAPNWVCTLRIPNPMAGMQGNTAYVCIQWTDPFYAKAIGGMSGMSGMSAQTPGYSITLSGVSFSVGSATLSKQAEDYLQQQLTEIAKKAGSNYKIVGHTDNVGSAQSNLSLSFKRASAVKDYFVTNGIDEEAIEVIGQGEAEPIADNNTVEGRKQNRRVELHVF